MPYVRGEARSPRGQAVMRCRPPARRLPSRTSCSAFSHLEGSRLAERPSPPGAGSPHEPSRMHGWSYAAMASRSGIAATAIRATPGSSALCGRVCPAQARLTGDLGRTGTSHAQRRVGARPSAGSVDPRYRPGQPEPLQIHATPKVGLVARGFVFTHCVPTRIYIHTDDVRNPCAVYSSATRCEPVRVPYRLL